MARPRSGRRGPDHLRRGDPVGVRALLTRAADRLASNLTAGAPYGLDLPSLVLDVRMLASHVEDQGMDRSPLDSSSSGWIDLPQRAQTRRRSERSKPCDLRVRDC